MPAEPAERILLLFLFDSQNTDSGRAFQGIEEPHRPSVADSAPQICPSLASDMVGSDERRVRMAAKKRGGFWMMAVTGVSEGDPKRSVNEDHR